MGGSRPQPSAAQPLPRQADHDGRPSCVAPRAFGARYGRRIAAGIHAPPGAAARAPAWWGRDHWCTVEVPVALAVNRAAARRWHVEPDTAKRVARVMARYADRITGRDCRPTNDRLAAEAFVSVRQMQRARGLLKELGLVVELVRGRAHMSRSERIAAWRRGSSHRQIAGEFALCSLRRPQRPRTPVERVTPPGDTEGKPVTHLGRGFFGRKDRREEPRCARRPPPRARNGPVTPAAVKSRRLIAGVQARIGWLSGVSPRRLTTLHRFARHGWTPRDVHRALDEVLRARGWSVPDRIEHPAAYLAALLRDVDPGDRPGALEEAMIEQERARRAWVYATTIAGRECAHGWLGGDLPHPVDGHLACPLCRRAETAPMRR